MVHRVSHPSNFTDQANTIWYHRAINIDNSFKIDRVNAVEITREKPSYTFPIIDAADRKEKNGKWYKQRLVFKPANIQSRSGESEPEVHGEIEVRVWRCAKIGELPKLPDAPHEEPANSKPNVRSTLQNRLRHIACLERTSTHNGRARKRNMKKAKQSKIIDRTFKVKYLDEDDEPYAEFKFLYGSSGKILRYPMFYFGVLNILLTNRSQSGWRNQRIGTRA
jgi:hypothetical protein